jgi:hypothetical protein
MSEEFKSIVETSYDNGIPLWLYTSDYIFGMVPLDNSGSRWREVSFTFEDLDNPLSVTERDADLSFQFLLEEVEKGLSFYIEDLNVSLIKDFAKVIEDTPGSQKMNLIINELIENSNKYSAQLPIIKNKNELDNLTQKI